MTLKRLPPSLSTTSMIEQQLQHSSTSGSTAVLDVDLPTANQIHLRTAYAVLDSVSRAFVSLSITPVSVQYCTVVHPRSSRSGTTTPDQPKHEHQEDYLHTALDHHDVT